MKTVLLVEDSEDDVFFMKAALKGAQPSHSLAVVDDGQAAIDYLSGANEYSDRGRYPLPSLVFLDIKLPKRSGHEVLEWLRAQDRFKHLPVVILTSSPHPADVERAYSLGTTSYIRKNSDLKVFRESIRSILHVWLEVNMSLPGLESSQTSGVNSGLKDLKANRK